MKIILAIQSKEAKILRFPKILFLFVCLFSFHACLYNPIVQSILCPDKDPSSSKSLLALWALLASSNSVVELNHTWAGIYKGDSLQLEAQYYLYGNKTDTTFQWTSSNESVATVSPTGLVQSVGNGKILITATSGDGRARATSAITVYSGYVYASLDKSDRVGHLTMNNNTGLLTYSTFYTAGDGPTGIGFDPSGKFLFTGDFDGGTISQFLINQTTGALTSNTPVFVTAGTNPRNLVITPDGKYLYLIAEGTQNIEAYSINLNGNLSFINSYTSIIGQAQIQISRSGKFILLMNGSYNAIVAYQVNPIDGSLSLVATSPSFTNGGTGYIATHPNGSFLYVGSFPAVTVLSFDDNTGNMTIVDSVPQTMLSNGAAIHPNGRFYYVMNLNNETISCYGIDPITGKISFLTSISGFTGSSLRYMIIDPTGRFAYVADNNTNFMLQFSINQTTGELTSMGTVDVGGHQWNLTFL
ncbi:6-phosphogluconolactonase [Leptospira kanakyensis]|uniref:6-phosphogluconolactonase n=1 Tax=Leptospira kanakyensis TaxID=2484968 RepID=A0A6N4QFH2_9LEPT|nr:beta-propeller fold lactonase family protein [Leptospira kanakyensis]TGK50740.1 6-phosphogluconolactonase [Leptospira kanakyensis]TGK63659.1 6-phosphogluconolactonase [Leptospira kanakyensis]TGK69877.1 6-phosphogluconolactonase [Leptospira kanakyensis]